MYEYQENNDVVSNAQSTVLSYQNSGNTKLLKNIIVEGNARGEWDIYINLVKINRKRTSVTNLSKNINLYNKTLIFNDIIEVKVTHYESVLCDFSVSLRMEDQ